MSKKTGSKSQQKRMTKLERRVHNEKILQYSKWYSGMSIGSLFAGALGVGMTYMRSGDGADFLFGVCFSALMIFAGMKFVRWSIDALDSLVVD